MRDFYSQQGYLVYDPIKKDFSIVFNEQVVLQRLTNLLSVYADQWQIDPTLYIDYTALKVENNLSKIVDTIRNKISGDPNFGGFTQLNVTFAKNVLNVLLTVLINGTQYTLTVNKNL